MPSSLSQLVQTLTPLATQGDLSTAISGICLYADKAQAGDVFMTVRGTYRDGHAFIPQAIAAGAVAVIGERTPQELVAQGWLPPDFPYVQVEDGRVAQAWTAAAFYGYPGRRLKVIGITGTDGKTTTATLTYSILRAAGLKVGAVTTVSARIGDEEMDTGFHTTTPDAPDLQRYLAQMVQAEMEVVVLETTSHSLAQKRVDAIDFDIAVVTNITHEHLDFHGSLAAYRQAKMELFRKLGQSPARPDLPKTAVLNADDSSIEYLAPIPADRQLRYGVRGDDDTPRGESDPIFRDMRPEPSQPPTATLDIWADEVLATPAGLRFTAHTPNGAFAVSSPLLGLYNVHNILAAIAVGHALGVSDAAMRQGVQAVTGISGRMEAIDEGQDFLAVVDFAHTPNALEQALKAARAMTQGRVIVVFGSAGLRDREKRRLMGEVAGRLADIVIVTAEDPRTEDLASIMAESVQAAEAQGKVEGETLFRVADRGDAIFQATQLAQPGDMVMTCGKGHEQSMCFGTTEYPWRDQDALRAALRGAPLRTLPTARRDA